jgi:hypothetical protein
MIAPIVAAVHARDQVDAGRDHGGGVDEGGDRRRALHGVREPGVQRDLGGLREGADEEEDEPRGQRAVVRGEVPGGRVEGAQEVQRVRVAEDDEGAQDEADVADHVDDERLDARRRRRRAPVPERDEQVGRGADEGPADDEQQEVGCHDEQQHREDEEVQVGEEARVAAVAAHVGHRVEVDERRHAGDRQRHEDAQRVDEDRQLAVDPDGVGVVPRDVDDLPRVVGAVLQRDEGRHGGDEGARDGGGADEPDDPVGHPAVAQRDDDRAGDREEQDEPCARLHG